MGYPSNAEYNKLVRDNIPEIIKSHGNNPITHISSDKEFFEKSKEKLTEEVQEYLESADPEELADILEVIYILAQQHNITKEELEKIRLEKKSKRGGFSKRIILEKTIELVKSNLGK